MSTVWYWNGGGSVWMVFMPLVWIVLLGLFVWVVVRLTQHPMDRGSGQGPRQSPRETPEEILDRRFASGEINADTYAEARERLAAHRPRPR
ncbi:SHOCT domain-containing protein [Streptomyces sp. NPDC046197]|uniref:SHOCT domain-containing protein n=1 Tax=Streptomyces sp. NPDC046197 TaxID=3154337 RepID=UPI0033FFE818